MSRGRAGLLSNVLFFGMALAALLGAFFIYRMSSLPKPKKKRGRGGFRFVVRTAPAELGTMARTLRLTGEIVPRRTVELRSEVSGLIRKVSIREGTFVKKGRAIVSLQNIDQRLQVDKQKAMLQQAKAMLLKAKASLLRERDLFRRTSQLRRSRSVSESDYIQARYRQDAAIASLAESQALIKLREAELSIARRTLSQTILRAPFAGTLAKLLVERGRLVSRGDLIAQLIGKTRVEARLFIPPRYIKQISIGMKVNIRISGGSRQGVQAIIERMLPTADANSRNRIAIVLLKQPPPDFLPGLPIESRVTLSEGGSALIIPKDALIRFGGGWVVYKVKDGKAVQVPVTIRNEDGSRVDISGALKAGDAIVVVGNEALFPNAPVNTGKKHRK